MQSLYYSLVAETSQLCSWR